MLLLYLFLLLALPVASSLRMVHIVTLPKFAPIYSVSFSKDSKFSMYVNLESPRIFDQVYLCQHLDFRGDQQIAYEDTHGALFYMGLSGVISFHGNQLVLWSLPEDLSHKFQPTITQIYNGHADTVWAAALVPDGTLMVSASGDSTVRLWDVATASVLHTFYHASGVRSVVVSPDGRWAVSGSYDMTAKVWDIANRSLRFTLADHRGAVWAVGYTPDGRYILSASHDSLLRLWDAATGKLVRAIDLGLHPISLAVSPDSQQVVCGCLAGQLAVFSIQQGTLEILSIHDEAILSVAYAPNGLQMASTSQDGSAKWWSLIDVNCKVSPWSEWQSCECIDGKQNRTRTLLPKGTNISDGCPDLLDSQPCHCDRSIQIVSIIVGCVLGAVLAACLSYFTIARLSYTTSSSHQQFSSSRVLPVDYITTEPCPRNKADDQELDNVGNMPQQP